MDGQRTYCVQDTILILCRSLIHGNATAFHLSDQVCSQFVYHHHVIRPNSMKIPMRCSLSKKMTHHRWLRSLEKPIRKRLLVQVTVNYFWDVPKDTFHELYAWSRKRRTRKIANEIGPPISKQCQLGSSARDSTYRPIGPLSSLSAMINGISGVVSMSWNPQLTILTELWGINN